MKKRRTPQRKLSDTKMTATVEVITPEIAVEMLTRNISNFRRVDDKRVRLYAEEMKAGCWEPDGASIVFDEAGIVLDGQHRLEAIVRSQCSTLAVVVRNATGSGRTIDRGKPRTTAQWMHHRGVANASAVASVVKMVICYERQRWSKVNCLQNDVVDSAIYEYAETYAAELQPAIRLASTCRHLLPVSMLGAVLLVGCGMQAADKHATAKWFCEGLAKGIGIGESDAVFWLRARLLAQTPQKTMSPFMKRMLTTIAWNKTVAGEECNTNGMRLRFTGPNPSIAPNELFSVLDFVDA